MMPANELKTRALARAGMLGERDDALAAVRAQARDRLEATPFPDRKTEQWKYTSLQPISSAHLETPAADAEIDIDVDFDGYQLVFVNGRYRTDLSLLPDEKGLTLIRLDGKRDPENEFSDQYRSPFAWLNLANLEDGLLLRVADNYRIQRPLHVIFAGRSDSPASCHTRLHLELGNGSAATLIEHYLGDGPLLTNAVTEIRTGIGSHLTHYRIQSEAADSMHIGTLLMNPGRDSQLHSFQLMQGSQLRRNDIQAILDRPGAHLTLDGVFVGRGKSHTDNQICIEHRSPDCTSEQTFRGMAGDEARIVFNGRIHIHKGAQRTNAHLSNKNLLLNPGAEIDTKPELEIYNDDVRCSHGATVGQIDREAIFYLRARGISERDAQRMLGLGFINELVMRLEHQPISDWALPWLGSSLTDNT